MWDNNFPVRRISLSRTTKSRTPAGYGITSLPDGKEPTRMTQVNDLDIEVMLTWAEVNEVHKGPEYHRLAANHNPFEDAI